MNIEKKRKILKKGKLNSGKIGKYRRKVSWIMKRYEKYGSKVSCIMQKKSKIQKKVSWLIKWYGKYGRKPSRKVIR